MTYLPCFPDSDEPLILHRLMMKKPEVFIEAICIVYRSDEDEQTEPSELEVKELLLYTDYLKNYEYYQGR